MRKSLLAFGSIFAAFSSWAASMPSHLYVVGGDSQLVDIIEAKYGGLRVYLSGSEDQHEETSFLPSDYLYVNGASDLSFIEQLIIKKAYDAGIPIVADLTGVFDNTRAVKLTQEIGGLGFSAPVVIVSKRKSSAHYIQLDSSGHQEQFLNASPGTRYQAIKGTAHDNFVTQLIDSIKDVTPSEESSIDTLASDFESELSLSTGMMTTRSASTPASDKPYTPLYTFTVTSNKVDINCPLPIWQNSSTFKNYCKGSMQLNYTIDLMRSIQGNVNGKATENAKFVRISVDAKDGGAGIKVSDGITREHPWHQSDVNYDETIGGFAERYFFAVYPTQSNRNITLKSHAPSNKNPEYEKREVTSTTLGFSGTAGGEATSAQGGSLKASASATATFSTTSSRWFTVTNQEYEIINQTSGDTARFVWDHRTQNRDDYFIPMAGTKTLFESSRDLFDLSRFSALSNQNFVPGFQATYKVSPNENGTHAFTIMTDVIPVAVYGKAKYLVTAHWRGSVGRTTLNQQHFQTINIDFSHPVFASEPTVYLQNLGHNDRVLDVYAGLKSQGAGVVTFTYHGMRNQLWGLDSHDRYRSRVAPNMCLTVDSNLSVTSRTCGHGLNQQWYWEGEKIVSRFVGPNPDEKYVLQMGGSHTSARVQVVPTSQASASASSWQPVLANLSH